MEWEVAYNAVYLKPLQDLLASLGSLFGTLLHAAQQQHFLKDMAADVVMQAGAVPGMARAAASICYESGTFSQLSNIA